MKDLEALTEWVELTGVAVLLAGALYAAYGFATDLRRRRGLDAYHRLRRDLGRSILLGLEILIIADIIGTIAVSPTSDDLYVLGLIVLIRTFLSFALDIEISGRLPWHREENPSALAERLPGSAT